MTYRVGTFEKPIRQSTIKSYFVCEFQGEMVVEEEPRNWLGTPAWLGTIGHKAAELLHGEPDRWGVGTARAPSVVPALVHEAWRLVREEKRDPLVPGQAEEIEGSFDALIESLRNYLELGWFDYHHNGLIGCEIPWRAKVGRWWCRGTMDILHQPYPGVLHLSDMKTGIRASSKTLGLDLQLCLYALAVWKGELWIDGEWVRIGRPPDKLSLFETKGLQRYKRNGRRGEKVWFEGDLKSKPEVEMLRGKRDFEDLEEQIDEMGARLNRLYTRGPRRMVVQRNGYVYGACYNCGYREQCPTVPSHQFLTESELVDQTNAAFGVELPAAKKESA